ncbi:MAG: putative exosortase interaction protein [Acidobacteriaceae bacterium]|nr:putative exosortase interaction protein [Acidobacteriaceae bacterium]
MMKKTVRTLSKVSMLALFVLAAALLLSSPASADTISLNLTNAVQTGTAGSTLSFFATVAAPGTNGGTVYLNGDNSNLDSPLTLNDDGFFLDFPLSLDAGDSFSGLLFTVTLPSNIASGLYTGFFEILGGSDGGSLDTLQSVNFQVNVAPVVSAVPEPESLMLLAAGLPGLAVLARSKRHLFAGRKA